MKIAIIGYGRMGHEVEQILLERGHEVVGPFGSTLDEDLLKGADAAIEFSVPEAAPANLKRCFRLGVPVVCGTTGWLKDYDSVLAECEEQRGGLLYASNFSLGVNLFFELNRQLAKLMAQYADRYQPGLEEIHHTAKLDKPSGTAITLAEGLLEEHPNLSEWKLDEAADNALEVRAIREPDVPGTHTVSYTSDVDKIEITHTAFSRKGFALGAVLAAEYMVGKSGLHHMRDVLNLNSKNG